jgi:hypothetical protein
MMRLRGSLPGRWRGSGDDRWVWIENFGRHCHRAKWSTDSDIRTLDTQRGGLVRTGADSDTRICPVMSRAGRADAAWSRDGLPGMGARPLSFYPFESTLNGQHEDHAALSQFSNILEFITCRLIRHKSAEMPPKVRLFQFFSSDGELVC